MSSPSASSIGPNPSSASINSNLPASPSLSTSTAAAAVSGGGGGSSSTNNAPTTTTSGTTSNAHTTNASNSPHPSSAATATGITSFATTTSPTQNPSTSSSSAPGAPNPELTARAHSALTTTLTSLGTKHLSPLQARAQDIHANATRISAQQAALEKSSSTFSKDVGVLEKEAGKAGEVLKGFGDLQNWAEVMEWELGVLERTMDLVEGANLSEDEEDVLEEFEGEEEDEEALEGAEAGIEQDGEHESHMEDHEEGQSSQVQHEDDHDHDHGQLPHHEENQDIKMSASETATSDTPAASKPIVDTTAQPAPSQTAIPS